MYRCHILCLIHDLVYSILSIIDSCLYTLLQTNIELERRIVSIKRRIWLLVHPWRKFGEPTRLGASMLKCWPSKTVTYHTGQKTYVCQHVYIEPGPMGLAVFGHRCSKKTWFCFCHGVCLFICCSLYCLLEQSDSEKRVQLCRFACCSICVL